MKRLVLVEDDSVIAETLKVALSYRGFATEVAPGVRSALQLIKRQGFDAAVVDVALPDGNGFELCSRIRQSDTQLPILMLTARTDETSAVRGIDCGADDYVRKPCGLDELTARLNRLMKRTAPGDRARRFRSIRVDNQARTAFVGEVPLNLRRREFEILSLLIRHVGEVVTREQVLEAMGQQESVFDRTIDSHLCRLRAKLKDASLSDARITSIYGVGYRLEGL